MKRYLDDRVRRDLEKKMVFLVGARQVGKTTFSAQLLAESGGCFPCLRQPVPVWSADKFITQRRHTHEQ